MDDGSRGRAAFPENERASRRSPREQSQAMLGIAEKARRGDRARDPARTACSFMNRSGLG